MPPTDKRLEDLDLGGMAARYGSYVTLSAEAAISLGSMEGMFDTEQPQPAAKAKPALFDLKLIPGYLLAACAALAAFGLAHWLKGVEGAASLGLNKLSTTMLAIILGVAIRNLIPLASSVSVGCKDIVKRVIPIAILCIGANLDLAAVANIGLKTLALTILCVLLAFAMGYFSARWLGLNHKTSLLLGSGTAICGSSAIAATAPLVEAEEDDMLLSIGTVNLVGLLAMLALPAAAVALGLDWEAFGVWCGTSIHAVPQVIAAADALGDLEGATALATLVKMGRVALLAPLVFMLALSYARRHAGEQRGKKVTHIQYAKLVPWFIWAFVGVALLGTLGLLPTLQFKLIGADSVSALEIPKLLAMVGKILLALAMAAIGLSVNLRALISVGWRSMAAGLISSVLLAVCSLLLIRLVLG